MRHWGGEHIFPGSAKAKAAERPPKPANQAALSGPLPDEQSLAPRDLPSVTGTKSETNGSPVVVPMSTAAKGSDEKRHQDRLLAQSFKQVEVIASDVIPPGVVQFRNADNEIVGNIINVADAVKNEMVVSLFDEDVVTTGSDEPTDAGKTDRKTYLREYMRARRQREREEKQRAAEAGTGATDQ